MDTLSNRVLKNTSWYTITLITLAFWLSSSLLLDFVIMPALFATGMMTDSGFATAGYSIFWIFNRLELLCAALVLTGVLALRFIRPIFNTASAIALSVLLFVIPLLYTYGLTPEMSALGMQLDLFSPTASIPNTMVYMQQLYWCLELVKLLACGALLNFCWKSEHSIS